MDPRLAAPDPAPEVIRLARARGGLRGLRVTVLGLGRFGGQIAACRFFAERGAAVIATDLRPAEALAEALAALDGVPVRFALGGHDEALAAPADLVVVSPAVPPDAPVLGRWVAAGARRTTELHLTLAALRAPVIAVTGSNGKSTTASMLARALAAGTGRRVELGGNIGRSLLEEAMGSLGPADLAVLELSSFMLDDLARLARAPAPRVGVVTNLAPNHLDRHGTLAAYARAKRRLIERLPAFGAAILPAEAPDARGASAGDGGAGGSDDDGGGGAWLAEFAAASLAPVHRFTAGRGGFAGPGAFALDGAAWVRERGRAARPVADLAWQALPGAHNRANALAALAAAVAAGAAPEAAARAALGFEGLPHRLEEVPAGGAVRCINDSKATTADAAVTALDALAGAPGPLVWVGGGATKGASFARLGAALAARADAVIVYGAARGEIARAVADAARGRARPVRIDVVETLDDAVPIALSRALPRGVVLLSPACASYDQFTSYEARGDRFRDLVGAAAAAPNPATSAGPRVERGTAPDRERRARVDTRDGGPYAHRHGSG